MRPEEPFDQLAVVEDAHVGMRDCNAPVLWFEVKLLHGGSLLVFAWESARKLIEDAKAYKVEDLNGKPCVVSKRNGFIEFVRWL